MKESKIESRIKSILNPAVRRRGSTAVETLAVAGFALCAIVPLAAVKPSTRAMQAKPVQTAKTTPVTAHKPAKNRSSVLRLKQGDRFVIYTRNGKQIVRISSPGWTILPKGTVVKTFIVDTPHGKELRIRRRTPNSSHAQTFTSVDPFAGHAGSASRMNTSSSVATFSVAKAAGKMDAANRVKLSLSGTNLARIDASASVAKLSHSVGVNTSSMTKTSSTTAVVAESKTVDAPTTSLGFATAIAGKSSQDTKSPASAQATAASKVGAAAGLSGLIANDVPVVVSQGDSGGTIRVVRAGQQPFVVTRDGIRSYTLASPQKTRPGQTINYRIESLYGARWQDEANVQIAQANLKEAEATYQRNNKLYEAGTLARNELEIAQARLEVAKANLTLAQKLHALHKQ